MRITDPKELTKGKEIFVVRCSPKNHSDIKINKYIVTRTPDEFVDERRVEGQRVKISDTADRIGVDLVSREFVGTNRGSSYTQKKTTFYLQDAGIIENDYNDHQTFDSLESAKQYICDFFGINFAQSKRELASAYKRAMRTVG